MGHVAKPVVAKVYRLEQGHARNPHQAVGGVDAQDLGHSQPHVTGFAVQVRAGLINYCNVSTANVPLISSFIIFLGNERDN